MIARLISTDNEAGASVALTACSLKDLPVIAVKGSIFYVNPRAAKLLDVDETFALVFAKTQTDEVLVSAKLANVPEGVLFYPTNQHSLKRQSTALKNKLNMQGDYELLHSPYKDWFTLKQIVR